MLSPYSNITKKVFYILILLAMLIAPHSSRASATASQVSPLGQEPAPPGSASPGIPAASEPPMAEPQPDAPLVPAAPGDHLVTDIDLAPDSPNILRTNQNVTFTFNYISNQPGGVRIWARPFSNGALTPNYAAHPSPLYPMGSGVGNGFFTITTGDVVVDQIRFQIYDSTGSTLLFEAFLPVYLRFTDAIHAVTNIALTPDTPDVLGLSQSVSFTFDYITRQPGGVRIWGRPFTNGALTPSYAAHGSPLHPTGGGSSSGFFTITNGQPVVDQLRIQMWDDAQSTLLFEAFLPVYFRFSSSPNIVTKIELAPDTPNIFKYSDNVNLTFDYTTINKDGVRIWARPFSGANLSPNYAAHGSIVHPAGSGSATGSFRLTSGPVIVDKVRVQMWTPDQSALLFEAFLPVHLLWAGSGPPPGPDMHVDAIEVTQAIQDLNNSVDLVAGKRTYVRVHASSPANVPDVFATLSGRRGFIQLAPILNPGNPGSDITVRTIPDRGQINDSFWFELPSSWTIAGNLTLTARLDPNGAKFDPDTSDNIQSITVNFKDTPPLRLRLVNVQYTSGGNTYLAANFHLDSLESWLRRAYPINSLQVSRQTFVYPTNGLPNVDTLHGWLALIKLFRILFNGEDGRVVYYGVVDDGGGFMRGKAADIPSTIAAGPAGTDTWGWDFDGSYNDWYGGHEIGHTRGRYHAEFCGAADGAGYPYTGGRISPSLTGNTAIYGFDITTRAIYGPSWKDVMTYCDNQWVSDFTYEGIRSYLVGSGMSSVSALEKVSADEFLAVMGLADLESNTANLESVYKIAQSAAVELPEPGEWELALVDGSSTDLAVYPFQPDLLTDAEESPGMPAVIAEILPWAAGAVRVEIRRQGALIASRDASANAPSVNLTSPVDGAVLPEGPFLVTWEGSDLDGDTLSYSLLYSNDGGLTWQTLAAGLADQQLELNTNDLPGGSAMLRVLVSDGFLSGQDTSGAISLPTHAPDVQIVLPEADQIFFPTQQVTLQGSAYDLEDGMLDDSAFVWESSLDGVLGAGATLNTSELTTGVHVLTLTATDSDLQSAQVQRTITIAVESAPEPGILQAAPGNLFVIADFGGAPVSELLTLRSSNETEINWTASEDLPWLSLDINAGLTPSDLNLTFDPSGLMVGLYSGVITLKSDQPGSSPVELPVTLQVTGNAIFLPMLQR